MERSSPDIVLHCANVSEALEAYRTELDFRIDSIYPADAPRIVIMSAHGLTVRLDNGPDAGEPTDELPENRPSLAVSKFGCQGFGTGRAGMQYRDLIPDRYGGRYIASHIRIPTGGKVPDYVHHHHVRFQLICCVKGWVRVAYEDQGEPMVMRAGDCFLQPPHIRHRVLECSDQMEVVEIACPADHETLVEHQMTLPTGVVDPERDFGGQRFVFHQEQDSDWKPWFAEGFEYCDTGIGDATNGAASTVTVRATGTADSLSLEHDADLRFIFVRRGSAVLECPGEEPVELGISDSCAIPPGLACRFARVSADFLFLETTAPG